MRVLSITIPQLIGLLISILGIAGLAIYSSTKPQTFANVNGSPIIAGIIMGTLVGGSSTVGTAQLAYTYGLSAWWFTLGGGLGCLILGLIYVKPLRAQASPTLVGMVREMLGGGSIFGFNFIGGNDGMLLFILAPGGFLVLGYLMALVKRLQKNTK